MIQIQEIPQKNLTFIREKEDLETERVAEADISIKSQSKVITG